MPRKLIILILLLGVAAIAWPHIQRSIWNDESWLVEYSYAPTPAAGWQHALDDAQGAAPGYIVLLQAVNRTLPRVETYRALSLIAFVIALLAGAWLLAQACRSRTVGYAAAAMLLAAPLFQRYATEVKQYMPAAAIILCLIIAAGQWLTTKQWRWAFAWLAAALLAVVLTFSGWFAVAGTGLLLAFAWAFRRQSIPFAATAGLGALVAGAAGFVYLNYVRHIGENQQGFDYWQQYMLPLSFDAPAALVSLLHKIVAETWLQYPAMPAAVILILASIGFGLWLWKHPWSAAAALSVLAAFIGINLAGKWPLAPRTSLAFVWIIHLAALIGPAWAVAAIGRKLRREKPSETSQPDFNTGFAPPATWVQWLCVVGALGVTALVGIETRNLSYEVAAARPLVHEVADHAAPGDLVILDWAAWANYRLDRIALPDDVTAVRSAFPTEQNFADWHLPRIHEHHPQRVLFAVGHHNEQLAGKWRLLFEQLPPSRERRQVWSGHQAALFTLEPPQNAP